MVCGIAVIIGSGRSAVTQPQDYPQLRNDWFVLAFFHLKRLRSLRLMWQRCDICKNQRNSFVGLQRGIQILWAYSTVQNVGR